MNTPLSKVRGALGSIGSSLASVAHKRGTPDAAAAAAPAASPDGGTRTLTTDCYGFQLQLTERQTAVLRGCAEREAAQAQRWGQYPPAEGLPPEDKLKKLCRRGVPPELREWVWMEVSGANRRRQQQHSSYFAAMHRMARHESPFVHQIELDLPRTYPANTWIQGEEGQAALRRVLCAFAQHKRDVGYCQGLNYIAAMLLLAMHRDEEKAFWLLASLIDDESEGILYQDMFANNLSGTHVEMRSLWELVSSKLPRLAAHLKAVHCDISILATDWFMCLFATTLPSETVARVWDALFHEGPKVLFRVALAVLKLVEPALLVQDDPGELLQALRNATTEMLDRDQLLKVAFEGIGSLSMLTIKRYRQVSQQQVDHEMAMRETNKNLQRALREGFVMPNEEVHGLREAESNPEPRDDQAPKGPWKLQLQALSDKYKVTVEKGKEKLLHHKRSTSSGSLGGGSGGISSGNNNGGSGNNGSGAAGSGS